jgi:hypothetical protein
MVAGIVAISVGAQLVIEHPFGHTQPAWVAVILGGPVLFLAGRAIFEYAVFGRVSRDCVAGVLVLAAISPATIFLPPVLVAAAAALVLAGIAVADAARARGRPPEPPSPPGLPEVSPTSRDCSVTDVLRLDTPAAGRVEHTFGTVRWWSCTGAGGTGMCATRREGANPCIRGRIAPRSTRQPHTLEPTTVELIDVAQHRTEVQFKRLVRDWLGQFTAAFGTVRADQDVTVRKIPPLARWRLACGEVQLAPRAGKSPTACRSSAKAIYAERWSNTPATTTADAPTGHLGLPPDQSTAILERLIIKHE